MFSRRPWMTAWYSPALLIKIGVQVLVSIIFGRHADQRGIQALTKPARVHDYSNRTTDRSGFWFSYMADCGDGWDSSYSVAYAITRPIHTGGLLWGGEVLPEGSEVLPEGSLLIFGGDQVYPTASREAYLRRFIAPFEAAWSDGRARGHLDVFAVPGNHDYYDSLRAFSRVFLSTQTFVCADTVQNRSYFACKLPHGWWLLGTDVQLGSDIDPDQVAFFSALDFKDDDRIILCTPEPHWLYPKRADADVIESLPTALETLETDVLNRKVSVYIAGDVHHYMRYASEDNKVHKITAGGGGAFLHPTHRTWENKITDDVDGGRDFNQKKCFPPKWNSFLQSFKNLLFPALNPRFGVFTGLLYLALAVVMLPSITRLGSEAAEFLIRGDFNPLLVRILYNEAQLPDPLQSLLFFVGYLATVGIFIALTEVPGKTGRVILGSLHGTVHWLTAYLITYAALWTEFQFDSISVSHGIWILGTLLIGGYILHNDDPSATPYHKFMAWILTVTALTLLCAAIVLDVNLYNIAVALIVFFSGWLIGAAIMGVYLLLAHNIMGYHWNGGFSSIRCKDWKNFLRFNIDNNGTLTIYPIGIRHVARRWTQQGEHFVPNDARFKVELIEAPVVIE